MTRAGKSMGRKVTAAAPIRILVVEDDAAYWHSLRWGLTRAGFDVVGWAATGAEARAAIAAELPDLVLLDVGLPDANGLELAEWVRDAFPSVLTVVLTGRPEFVCDLEPAELGISAMLRKPMRMNDLCDVLRSVVRRPSRRGRVHVTPSASPPQLTGRKQQVLTLVARGWPNWRVAEELGLTVRTIDTHVADLLKLLGVNSRTALPFRAVQLGLLPVSAAYATPPG